MLVGRTRTVAALTVALGAVLVAPAASQAAGWLPVETLRTSPTEGSTSGDTAMAPDGTALTAFNVLEGGVRRAVVASRRPGEAFGPSRAISSAASSI
ncbi:MAG: hypothetical protein Q7T55_18255, partial [Solirubrobacteraceae bacterium]|nr:hypothetical protein [Solirubrobacteraceae bacterium]